MNKKTKKKNLTGKENSPDNDDNHNKRLRRHDGHQKQLITSKNILCGKKAKS